jgi:hypothetical protein
VAAPRPALDLFVVEEQENPYSSPGFDVSGPKLKRGSPVKAVLLGVLVDIGGSVVAGVVLVIAAGLILGFQGMPAERIEEELTNTSPDSWLSIAGYIVGCLCSFLGGYVCALVAKRSEYKLAGIVAFISAWVSYLFGMQYYSVYMNALSSVLAVLCVMLGAARGVVRNERKI